MKEFTKKEFEEFVQKNNYETFTSNQVEQFEKSILAKQGEMDSFEKSCIAAEFVSLHKAVILEENLTKSIVFYRPIQVEPIEKDQTFSSDLLKSKSLRYKDTELNRFRGIVGLVVDADVIEKARKAEPIGTEKTYGGKLYIKTEKGWRPKAKKSQAASKAEEKPGSEVHSTPKKETSGEAPEGVTQESYDSITKKARATQRGYTLNIDGKDVRVERTIDTSGSQRVPIYQIQGMEKKYWDLDKMIRAYRKEKQKDSIQDKKESPLKREITAAQYGGDRKEELNGEIAKLRFKLMKKYDSHGSSWETAAKNANDPDAKRLQSLNERLKKLK